MPKLPMLSAKKLIKALRKDGFVFHRSEGSHHHYFNTTKNCYTTIPVHPGKDLGRGLVKAILKQAKLTEVELLRLL